VRSPWLCSASSSARAARRRAPRERCARAAPRSEAALLERVDRLARALELAELGPGARGDRVRLGCCTPRARERLLRERHRLLVLPALEVDPRELERRFGLGVVRAHRLAQLGDRAVPVAEVARGEPGEEARGGVVRPRAHALLELRERAGRVALREQDPPAQQLRVVGAGEAVGDRARAVELADVDQRVGEHEAHALVAAAGQLDDLLDRRERAVRLATRAVERREQVPRAGRLEAVDRLEQHLLGLVGLVDRLQPRGEALAQVEALGRRRDRVAPQAGAALADRRRCRRTARWLITTVSVGLRFAQSS
jgi:hypothetical protein